MRVVGAQRPLAHSDRALAEADRLLEVAAVVSNDGQVLETAGDQRVALAKVGDTDLCGR